MLILLTFAVSDNMSHALSPQPGKREEEPARVKNKKAFEKHGCCLQVLCLCPLCLFFFCSSPTPLFISFLMPCTSQQATAICMMRSASAFLQLFRSACLPAPACGCPYLSVFASVNVRRPAARKLRLQEKGMGIKKKKKRRSFEPIDVSHSNQGNMLKYVTGKMCHVTCIFQCV